MRVWDESILSLKMQDKKTNPYLHGKREVEYSEIIERFLKKRYDNIYKRAEGCEIGAGTGRLIFRLAKRFRMFAFEAYDQLKRSPVVGNFYCYKDNFLLTDIDKFFKKFDFVILDNHEYTNDEDLTNFVDRILKILKPKGYIIVTGEGIFVHKFHGELMDRMFTSVLIDNIPTDDITRITNNYGFFQIYSEMNDVQKHDSLESEESETGNKKDNIMLSENDDIDKLFEDNSSVTLNKETILKLRTKKQAYDIYKAIGEEDKFNNKLKLSEIKQKLFELSGWVYENLE